MQRINEAGHHSPSGAEDGDRLSGRDHTAASGLNFIRSRYQPFCRSLQGEGIWDGWTAGIRLSLAGGQFEYSAIGCFALRGSCSERDRADYRAVSWKLLRFRISDHCCGCLADRPHSALGRNLLATGRRRYICTLRWRSDYEELSATWSDPAVTADVFLQPGPPIFGFDPMIPTPRHRRSRRSQVIADAWRPLV